MKRIKLRKKRKIKNLFVLIIILFIIIFNIIFKFINNKLSYILSNYATVEAKKVSNYIISTSIKDIKLDNDLYKIENNQINLNTNIINEYLSTLAIDIHDKLNNFEQGIIDDNLKNKYGNLNDGIIYEVPLSSILNYPLISNIGFKIPIKINFIGDVITKIKTEVIDYGINNALIKIYVDINITEEVLIPFKSKKINIKNNALVSVKLIQGNVPEFYSGSNDSQFTIPLD